MTNVTVTLHCIETQSGIRLSISCLCSAAISMITLSAVPLPAFAFCQGHVYSLIGAAADNRLALLHLGYKHLYGLDGFPKDHAVAYSYYANIGRQTSIDKERVEDSQVRYVLLITHAQKGILFTILVWSVHYNIHAASESLIQAGKSVCQYGGFLIAVPFGAVAALLHMLQAAAVCLFEYAFAQTPWN